MEQIFYKVFIHYLTGTVTKTFQNPYEIIDYLKPETNAITKTSIEKMLASFERKNKKINQVSSEPYFLSGDFIVVEQITN